MCSLFQFTLKLLKHLSNFTNLEELRVYYDKPVPYYPWIKALRNLKKLRVVFIEENYVSFCLFEWLYFVF